LTRKISKRLTEYNKELSRILLELEEMVGETPSPKPRNVMQDLVELGFTRIEAKSWLKQEPDFARQISTDLDTRRRGNRTPSDLCFLTARTAGHSRMWKSSTRNNQQPHQPSRTHLRRDRKLIETPTEIDSPPKKRPAYCRP